MGSSAVDSERRLTLPSKVMEKLGGKEGDEVIFEEGEDGAFSMKLGRKKDSDERFKKLIPREPKRTIKPKNWSPARMKGI
jgi:bifunctional DNA-binding transcriptional regulator/antitoxin component of YhaV-PrlF toxin-antitoxin module